MSNNYHLTQLLSFSQRQIAMAVNKLQGADIGSLQRAEAGSRYYITYIVDCKTSSSGVKPCKTFIIPSCFIVIIPCLIDSWIIFSSVTPSIMILFISGVISSASYIAIRPLVPLCMHLPQPLASQMG